MHPYHYLERVFFYVPSIFLWGVSVDYEYKSSPGGKVSCFCIYIKIQIQKLFY